MLLGYFDGAVGAEIVEGRFEDTATGVGAFIFTHPLSTTFRWALDRNMPAILIDFGFATWRPQILERLRSRVSIVKGVIDQNGRMDFDRGALIQALESLQVLPPARPRAASQRAMV